MPRDTPIEDAILEFLRDWKNAPSKDGNSPTYAQIATGVGKYPADVHKCVQAMVRKGKLQLNEDNKIALGGKYILPE